MIRSVMIAVCLASFPLCAQDSTTTEAPMRTLLERLAQSVSDRSLAGIDSLDEWKRRRPATRRKLLSALGLDPLPQRTPLDADLTGIVDQEKFRVLTLTFKALPACT